MKVFDEFFVLVRGSLKVVQMDHFTGTPSRPQLACASRNLGPRLTGGA